MDVERVESVKRVANALLRSGYVDLALVIWNCIDKGKEDAKNPPHGLAAGSGKVDHKRMASLVRGSRSSKRASKRGDAV